MPWRNWSVIIILVLANYVVFSIIGTLLFPVVPQPAPTHVVRPTFTPGIQPPQRIVTLTFDPSPTSAVTATGMLTTTATPPRVTVVPTRSP